MEFKELEVKLACSLRQYGEKNKIRIDDDFILLKLNEEVGELAQAALIYKDMCREEVRVPREKAKEKLAEELADVAGIIFTLASIMNIDLEKKLQEKWIDKWLDKEF